VKDFLGNELAVGDDVVFMSTSYAQLRKGTIIKINKVKCTIQGFGGEPELRTPDRIFRVGAGEVTEFAKFEVESGWQALWLDARFTTFEAEMYVNVKHKGKFFNRDVQLKKV
jgi:hypothetical protein